MPNFFEGRNWKPSLSRAKPDLGTVGVRGTGSPPSVYHDRLVGVVEDLIGNVNALSDKVGDLTGLITSFVGDISDELQAAVTFLTGLGYTRFTMKSGSYRVDKTITLPVGSTLLANGVIWDKRLATTGSLTSGNHVYINAPLTLTNALAVNAVIGGRTIVLSGNAALVKGDVLIIHNPTNGSFSSVRNSYKAGEFVRVNSAVYSAGTNQTTVTLATGLYDSYNVGTVNIYKMYNSSTTTSIEGLTILCAGLATPEHGIFISGVVDLALDSCTVTGPSISAYVIDRCYQFGITDCIGEEDFSAATGNDYALTIANSQKGTVTAGYYRASRHATTSGGYDVAGSVPSRDILYLGVNAETTGTTVAAMDAHGNCEDIEYLGCHAKGGFVLGGNRTRINGGFANNTGVLPCVQYVELVGLEHKINGLVMESDQVFNGEGAFVKVEILSYMKKGGRFVVSADMTYNGAGNNQQYWLNITNTDFTPTATEPLLISIIGNTVRATKGRIAGANVANLGGTPFTSVSYSGNETHRASGLRCVGSLAFASAVDVDITDNKTSWGWDAAHTVDSVINTINYHSNTNRYNHWATRLGGIAGRRNYLTSVRSITSIDEPNRRSGSFTTDVGIAFASSANIVISDVSIGGRARSVQVASAAGFVVGDTVNFTGGVTATILEIVGTEIYLGGTYSALPSIGNSISGTLGGSSTVTNVLSSTQHNVSYLSDIGNLRRGDITSIDGLTQHLVGGAVTSDGGL